MRSQAWKWLAIGGVAAVATGGILGASIGQESAQRPVVTVYSSPT